MKFIVSSRRATSSEVQNKVKVQRLDSQEFVKYKKKLTLEIRFVRLNGFISR